MGRLRRQAAVIPFRSRSSVIEIAAITSLTARSWILPKGWIEDGEDPWDAAAREAMEEAGVLGIVQPVALGRCDPALTDGCIIDVYALSVAMVLEHWPEDDLRVRRWMSLHEAAVRLREEFRPFVAVLDGWLRQPINA